MMESGVEALFDVGITYIEESVDNCPTQNLHAASQVLLSFLKKQISYEEAQMQFQRLIGNTTAIDKIYAIVTLPDEPIPTFSPPPESSPQNPRQKSRTWTAAEDQRLLAGIYKFGFESWNPVANYVGNGRTRSQCSQRWARGLNPKISKCAWNAEEEAKLVKLVAQYGDKSWTRIASELGNRSDVQCRYKFQQIKKDSVNNDTNPQVRSPYDMTQNQMAQHTPQDSVNQTMMHSPANVGPMPGGMHSSVGMTPQGPQGMTNPAQYPQSPHVNQQQMQMGQPNPYQMMGQNQEQHPLQQFQNMSASMQNMMMPTQAMQQSQMMQNQMQQMHLMQMQQFQMMQNQMQQMQHQQSLAQSNSQKMAGKSKKPRQQKAQQPAQVPQHQHMPQPPQQNQQVPFSTPQQNQISPPQIPAQQTAIPSQPQQQQTQQVQYSQMSPQNTNNSYQQEQYNDPFSNEALELSFNFPKPNPIWYSEV